MNGEQLGGKGENVGHATKVVEQAICGLKPEFGYGPRDTRGGNRTHMTLRSGDFKSPASHHFRHPGRLSPESSLQAIAGQIYFDGTSARPVVKKLISACAYSAESADK